MKVFVIMVSLHPMLNKQEQNEEGFTLVEILVVILIIGILSAIAIPVFLNQRKEANDSAAVQEATNIAKAIETYFVNNKTETVLTAAAVTEIRGMVKKTNGVGAYIYGSAKNFCIQTWHSNGKVYRNDGNWNNQRPYYLYANKDGGNTLNSGYGGGVSSHSCYLDNPNSQFNLWNP